MLEKLIGEKLRKISSKIFGTMNDESGETYLSVEEDIHAMFDYDLSRYIITTRSCSSGYEQYMKYALPLMEYLLNGYTVLTRIYVSRRQKEAIEYSAKFCTDYAETSAKDPSRSEKVYINGEGEMIAITKGINKNLVETIMNTPELVNTVGYWQVAYAEMPEQNSITDFQSAFSSLEKDSVIDAQCLCARAAVTVGISKAEGAEMQLIDKLLEFARLHKTKIDFIWLDDVAITHPDYTAILYNRPWRNRIEVVKRQG